ncbi:hypothetical protein VNO77_15375 [Canavalia gladiata]|uniref:Uncharacterized protein n=1 Tax=Canavalia gladiata TaxID=3824 RepID=A0AAN9QP65_CANGL
MPTGAGAYSCMAFNLHGSSAGLHSQAPRASLWLGVAPRRVTRTRAMNTDWILSSTSTPYEAHRGKPPSTHPGESGSIRLHERLSSPSLMFSMVSGFARRICFGQRVISSSYPPKSRAKLRAPYSSLPNLKSSH